MDIFVGRAYFGAILIPPSILFNYLSVDLAILKAMSEELAALFGLMLHNTLREAGLIKRLGISSQQSRT